MADGGVEWQLELSAKLGEATAMLKVMTSVESEALRADAAMKKLGKSTRLSGDIMRKAGASFKSVGASALGHFTALATFDGLKNLANRVADLGMEMLQAAGEAERTRESFHMLMGEKPGDEMLEWIDKVAEHSQFTDGPLKDFATQLAGVGFQGEELKNALAATGDMASMTKDKMVGAGQAIGLLSRLKLRGTITERDMFSAKISPEKFYAQVAADTGLGLKQVKKKIQQGKVEQDVLLQAFYKGIVARPASRSGVPTSTWGARFLAQLEKAKDILPNLFEELENSQGKTDFTKGLSAMTKALSPSSPAGKAIITGLDTMLSKFGKLVAGIDFEKWAGRLAVGMEMFTAVVDVGAQLGKELGEAFDALTGFGAELGGVIFDIVEWGKDLFNTFVNIGSRIWQGMVQGISSGITKVVDSVKFLGSEAVNGITGLPGIRSPSAVFAGFGVNTGEGFVQGIESMAPDVGAAVADTFSPDLFIPHPGGVGGPTQMLDDALGGAFAPDQLVPHPGGVGGPTQMMGDALGGGAVEAPLFDFGERLGPVPGAAAMAAPAPAGDGGAPKLEAHVTINIGGPGEGPGATREVAEAAESGALRGLEAAFRQFAQQGWTS